MNPVIVIPTFATARRNRAGSSITTVYDHATPLTSRGELPRCLESLRNVEGVGQIIVLVVSEPNAAAQAARKAQGIVDEFPDMSIAVIGDEELSLIWQRMDEIGIGGFAHELNLQGYAAMRNVGLLLANVLGFDAIVFLDDDAVVEDPDFLKKAVYGLGKFTRKGIPILAKSGYYLNARGTYLSLSQNKWYNHFWQQGKAFNAWIHQAMNGPRLSRSNHVCGGCLILHREAFRRVAFDPWIVRGEDLDYMLDLRMYGSDIWFDNKWWMRHLPPNTKSEGVRFRQDIYRWLYEYRKMEYSRTQIDLLQVKPASLEPYPGPFLEPSIGKRIRITALLRSFGSPDKKAYREAAKAARYDAEEYAQENCAKYFEFQQAWPDIMARLEGDIALRAALVHAVELRTFGYPDDEEAFDGEFGAAFEEPREEAVEAEDGARAAAEQPPAVPHVPRQTPAYAEPDAYSLDPGLTSEIRLNLDE